MSVRDLPEDRDDGDGQWSDDVSTIERIAETKGIADDIDDIDVQTGETDTGEDIVQFRIYVDKVLNDDGSVDEVSSVGSQVAKMPNVSTAQDTFRQDVQNTLSSLKRYLMDEEEADDDDDLPDPDEVRDDETDDDSGTATRTTTDATTDGAPGATIDARIADHEERIQELEERVEELEEYVDALEGLQKLMGGDGDA